jgi:hypothetical protein
VIRHFYDLAQITLKSGLMLGQRFEGMKTAVGITALASPRADIGVSI